MDNEGDLRRHTTQDSQSASNQIFGGFLTATTSPFKECWTVHNCKEIIDLLEADQWPLVAEILFDFFSPSSLSRTLEGLFELARRPSRALDSPHALLPVLGHCQKQLTQTLIAGLLKTHFFTGPGILRFKDRCKKIHFSQTLYNQGLRQLFLTVFWDLHA